MKIAIIAIGKKHDSKLANEIEHYSKMLGSSSPNWILLDSQSLGSKDTQKTKTAEGKLILQNLKAEDKVVVLDERGKQLDSPEFADMLEKFQLNGTRRLVFVIGGAFGLEKTVINRADFVWSFSKLVFPHQLVRLIIMEQLYRATTILSGKQYHY